MKYEWSVETATLATPQPYEPPQLDEVLNRAERRGWEVFAVVNDPATNGLECNRLRVVLRRALK